MPTNAETCQGLQRAHFFSVPRHELLIFSWRFASTRTLETRNGHRLLLPLRLSTRRAVWGISELSIVTTVVFTGSCALGDFAAVLGRALFGNLAPESISGVMSIVGTDGGGRAAWCERAVTNISSINSSRRLLRRGVIACRRGGMYGFV